MVLHSYREKLLCVRENMEAPPVSVMPVTGGTINMMEYLLQGKLNEIIRKLIISPEVLASYVSMRLCLKVP